MKVESLHHGRLVPIPAFSDNYIWLVRAATGRACLVVDPGDGAAVLDYTAREGLEVRQVLVTHHHADHTGGISVLKAAGAVVAGPRHEAIAGIDQPAGDGDRIACAELGLTFDVLDVPGHTAGHVAYTTRLDERPLVFCGDTLFSGGCGRLFEGTAAEMAHSLARLAMLPRDTLVCCAHEYTLGNLRFAAAVEPDNADIAAVTAWARERRAAGMPTLPSDIARELAINPFLRTREEAVIHAASAQAHQPLDDAIAVFAALRRWKDGFR